MHSPDDSIPRPLIRCSRTKRVRRRTLARERTVLRECASITVSNRTFTVLVSPGCAFRNSSTHCSRGPVVARSRRLASRRFNDDAVTRPRGETSATRSGISARGSASCALVERGFGGGRDENRGRLIGRFTFTVHGTVSRSRFAGGDTVRVGLFEERVDHRDTERFSRRSPRSRRLRQRTGSTGGGMFPRSHVGRETWPFYPRPGRRERAAAPLIIDGAKKPRTAGAESRSSFRRSR